MEATAVHPKQALVDFFARSIRKQAYIIAFWVDSTAPDKLDWVPGEPGVTKARTILDQMSELINIHRSHIAGLKNQKAEESEKITVTNAEEVRTHLLASANELADLVQAMSPDMLDHEVDSPIGKMPLLNLMEISLLWNTSYHGGVINAYQLMYGDEKFHIPPMG